MTTEQERTNDEERCRTTDQKKVAPNQGTKKSAMVCNVQGGKWKSFSALPPMKLRTPLISISELKVADHVVLTYGAKETHGIILDKQDDTDTFTLMEFTKGMRPDKNGILYQIITVQETRCGFGDNVKVSVVIYDKGEVLPDPQVLSNAKHINAELNFYDLSRRCESLARRCKTGQFELARVESSYKTVLKYSFWLFVAFLCMVNPLGALFFALLCFVLIAPHEGYKCYQDVYKIKAE